MIDSENQNFGYECYLEFYKEHGTWARHQEQQRAITSNLILTITTALFGLILYDKKIDYLDLPLTISLIVVGIFGVLFIYKFYVQFKFHDSRIDAYKKQLCINCNISELSTIENDSDLYIKHKYKIFSSINLYMFWISLNIVVILSGTVLTAISIL